MAYKNNIKPRYCKRGHFFSKKNTYVRPKGGRFCRKCMNSRMCAYRVAHPDRIKAYVLKRKRAGIVQKKPIAICNKCLKLRRISAFGYCSTCYQVTRKEQLKTKLLRKQRNKCAIRFCKTDVSNYTLRDWQLDHDHKCVNGPYRCDKCTRGLLCKPCNLLIGLSRESVKILRSVIAYIRRLR